MRVALLSFNAHDRDAIGNQVAEKLGFFLERGADARVFLETGGTVHAAVRNHACVIKAAPRGEAWQFISDADLVIAEYGQYYELLSLLPLLGGRRPRVLVDYYGVTPPELWGPHNREALERGARHRGLVWCADAVVIHSRCTQRELSKACAFPGPRTHRIGLPVDTARFHPGTAQTRPRAELGLENALVLLVVGRVAPSKRLPTLVEALARLRDVQPNVHALIVGNTTDLYHDEMNLCRELARQLGVAERLHFLGSRSDAELAELYRAADLFVTPSRSEGFCLPVIEAMASGLPVVAARATALPETVGDAGLTFRPDDADDLARQIRRALPTADDGSDPPLDSDRRRSVAVVSFRYGADLVGGAERSLRVIADQLRQAGHGVEVFTTCTRAEGAWANELAEGTTSLDGVPVHRFRIDTHDRANHLRSVDAILQRDGIVSAELERDYLQHSIHSAGLLDALARRRTDFDAIVVGPYLFGLTHDVASAFADKTVLVPCFHDEPLARLAVWPETYGKVAGIWYHSPEERAFAHETLGLNHPGAVEVGTWMATEARGDPQAGRRLVGAERYVVYCGRYSAQKDLVTLLDYGRRYHAERPGRFRFAFLGQGEVPIPAETWATDLGFVGDETKRDVLAGAAALVQLSRFESLSLVALEAWAQGVPVLGSADCAVMAGQIERSGGGQAVADYEAFRDALDDLWDDPLAWQTRGGRGRDYVAARYGSAPDFRARLARSLGHVGTPLRDQMRRKGLERAAQFQRPIWRAQFARVVETLLDDEARPFQFRVEIEPQAARVSAAAGAGRLLLPVRITNRGSHALAAEGPGRTTVRARIATDNATSEQETTLAGVLAPGQTQSLAVAVAVPARAGEYDVQLWAICPNAPEDAAARSTVGLAVEARQARAEHGCCTVLLDEARAALAEAERRQSLPEDYTDVTQGWFARWKRWLKRKLLGNFKHAYVDVLSRQQSQVNRQLIAAVQQLADSCATLDHAVRSLDERLARIESATRAQEPAAEQAESYR